MGALVGIVRRRVAYESAMAAVAVASVALVFVWRVDPGQAYVALVVVDLVLVAVQLADWAWGLRRAASRGHYVAVTGWELLGLVPLSLADSGTLRLLRLMRLIRLVRAVRDPDVSIGEGDVSRTTVQVYALSWAAAGATVASALLVWLLERGGNDTLDTFGEALWWAVVTVTQVGYGDSVPLTTLGRAVASILMVGGIALFVVLLSVISLALVRHEGVQPQRAGDVDGLERLSNLHDEGKLDDDEYREAKSRLLGLHAKK